MVGPNYQRPPPADPPTPEFKETTGPVIGAAADFQPAMPRDAIDRGPWWSMYDDPDARPAGGADRHLQPDADAGRSGLPPGARPGAAGCVRPLSDGLRQCRLHAERQRQRQRPQHARAASSAPASGSVGQFTAGPSLDWQIDVWGRIRRQIESDFGGGPGERAPTSPMPGCRRRPIWRSTTSRCASPSSASGSSRRRWRPSRARPRSCRTSSTPASSRGSTSPRRRPSSSRRAPSSSPRTSTAPRSSMRSRC